MKQGCTRQMIKCIHSTLGEIQGVKVLEFLCSSMSEDTVTITKEEFDRFASSFADEYDTTFRYAEDVGGNQIVYEFDVPDAPDDVVLYVFSSINDEEEYEGEAYAGESRAKGYGSIKSTLWHKGVDKPVLGRSHTKRIETWEDNLRPKLSELMEEQSYHCDSCSDGIMVIQTSEYGKFKGCTNYPDCKNKEDL